MNRIAFVTTCKSRLDHLQQTLPRLVAEQPDEIVVVDYGCPQGTGDWVESAFPQVKLVRVEDDPGFCVARARNFGAAAVESEWICFVDADVLASAGWVDWMRSHLRPGSFFRVSRVREERRFDLMGTAVVLRSDFERIGGYDEVIRGWGGEDVDLYDRLQFAGCRDDAFPGEFVSTITHGDERRFTFHELKSKRDRMLEIRCYRAAKKFWTELLGVPGHLPLDSRTTIHARLSEAFEQWVAQPEGALPEFSFEGRARDFVLGESVIEAHFRCTLRLVSSRHGRRSGSLLARTVRRLRARMGLSTQPSEACESLIDIAGLLRKAQGRLVSILPGDRYQFCARGFADEKPRPYRLFAECSLLIFPRQSAVETIE